MDLFDQTSSVERLRFFDGQPLFAADLDGIADFNSAMRWLHNRSLHQPGIGNGYAVSGKKGDREVSVQPGYALDNGGREIVLLDTDVEAVPPVAAERDGTAVFFDLTVSYPADADLEEAETRDGICLPRGAVRLRERPVFCWVRLERDVTGRLKPVDPTQGADIDAGVKITLARAQVRNCQLDADLSILERRNARPPVRPHIACGRQLGNWDLWTATDSSGKSFPIGVTMAIDTTGASFHVTPCYSARVDAADGARPLQQSSGTDNPDLLALDMPAFVESATASGFTCNVAVVNLTSALDDRLGQLLVAQARNAWGVVWLGIEE